MKNTVITRYIIKTVIGLLLIIAAFCIFILIKKGAENKTDPAWIQLDSLLKKQDFFTLDKAENLLQNYFDSIQRDQEVKKLSALKLISKPFLPTCEYNKFNSLLRQICDKHFVVISGVSGAGKTTLVKRIERFISADESRELYIACVPQFEIEYNKRYIGTVEKGKFVKGKLVEFIDKAFANPQYNYVIVLDEIDKINPESFFGAEFWGELENQNYTHKIEDYEVKIPDNLFMISVTHEGISQRVELNDEHFRRLGTVINILPEYRELYVYALQEERKNKKQFPILKEKLYFFIKANELIRKKYTQGHMLGQWSNLRKKLDDNDLDAFSQIFIEHVNAFKPLTPLEKSDFDDIYFSIHHNGKIPHSNFFAGIYQFFYEAGLVSELSVGILFALISGIFGLVVFIRKRNFIKSYIQKVYTQIDSYRQSEISYEQITKNIIDVKRQIDALILKRKLNYTEAIFFYNLIEDRLKSIEEIKRARSLNEEFINMFNGFMGDDIIDDHEYKILNSFLHKIKFQIPEKDYLALKDKLENAHRKS